MVTLLLTFFAVLLSMSSVDSEKFNAFIRSFSNLPPEIIEEIVNSGAVEGEGEHGSEPEPIEAMDLLYEYIDSFVSANDASGVVEVSFEDGMIYIRFNTALLFYPDEYMLLPESYPTLEYIGEGLKMYEDAIKMVAVIGHTADPMDGSDRNSGWMLSGERASTIASYLEYTVDFNPKKVVTMGYGKHYPVADNSMESTRALNRRVEMVIVGVDSNMDVAFYDALGKLYNNEIEGAGTDLFEPISEMEGAGADLAEPVDGLGEAGADLAEPIAEE